MVILKSLKEDFEKLKGDLYFQAFVNGYTKGYNTYIKMRERYNLRSDRVTEKAPVVKAPRFQILHKHWHIGFEEGWSDAHAAWCVSYSLQGMREIDDDLSFTEERIQLEKRWKELAP